MEVRMTMASTTTTTIRRAWSLVVALIAISLGTVFHPAFAQLPSSSTSSNTTIRIDCGASQTFVNEYNETWLSDRYYTGGWNATVVTSASLTRVQERTLRYFPLYNGKKNCYIVDGLPTGRYSIRMFFIYGNYDGRSQTPSFDVSVEGTVVFSWRNPWSKVEAETGVYSDLFTFIKDGDAKICFYSIATDTPVIGALELVSIDPLSYNSDSTGTDVILVNYGRFAGAVESFGAGISSPGDRAGRAWEPDATLAHTSGESFYLDTQAPINNADVPPNFFPQRLYQSAHTLTTPGSIEYLFTVDSSLDYMLCFHFAEIDSAVIASGQRVFDIIVNNQVVYPGVDVFALAGKYTAYDLVYTTKNLTGSALNVTLASRVGPPMISGLENYALLPMDLSTDPSEVLAMNSLKESLQVPERMGWNGDPCAPYNWDTWEGVTCNTAPDGKSLVITRLDLTNQGLRGTISDKISLLQNLISLNMSSNNIQGVIPSGLGRQKLRTMDLSFNELTGNIPDSLGQAQLVNVILNNNHLQGQVPLSLYSVGVRGGYINISSNAGLCGVPALPNCPHFWEDKKLSTGAKVGIGFAVLLCIAAIAVLIFFCIIRRGKDDYNFGLPHQLATKSHRYQRHKQFQNNPKFARSKFGFAPDMNPL